MVEPRVVVKWSPQHGSLTMVNSGILPIIDIKRVHGAHHTVYRIASNLNRLTQLHQNAKYRQYVGPQALDYLIVNSPVPGFTLLEPNGDCRDPIEYHKMDGIPWEHFAIQEIVHFVHLLVPHLRGSRTRA
ncbi:hypothetical protein Dda_8194 [Drechslerella dactyloides]|uniref:Uncharacterized protein n=1 Tax=Drechslerella dactyloides TaxID=74499 RepID=A0AAD6NGD5_DREDA|nr:hypothetical protein Dda_8194 [Drechslerella dactyloides]